MSLRCSYHLQMYKKVWIRVMKRVPFSCSRYNSIWYSWGCRQRYVHPCLCHRVDCCPGFHSAGLHYHHHSSNHVALLPEAHRWHRHPHRERRHSDHINRICWLLQWPSPRHDRDNVGQWIWYAAPHSAIDCHSGYLGTPDWKREVWRGLERKL